MKREEKEEEEKKKERDYSCIVTANACITDTLCILSYANWTLRSEIATDENRGNRLFTLFGIASAWHARARASELTENKFRPVSNSADPPWNYVTHIPYRPTRKSGMRMRKQAATKLNRLSFRLAPKPE